MLQHPEATRTPVRGDHTGILAGDIAPAVHDLQRSTTPTRVFEGWSEDHTALWGRHPIKLQHTLHKSPLFSMDGLAELIDAYPREFYMLVYMGAQNDKKFWREGDIAGMPGKDVINAIAQGRLWLNLRRTNDVDSRYGRILDQMFDEIGAKIGNRDGFDTRSFGILISSPGAQVYYHCDLPNQSLWQVAGRKRVFVYPNKAPFLRGEDLERIATFEVEVDIPYDGWYDKYAQVYDLEPGEMLHWPLNSPHRVVNYDVLNVSITTEYWAREALMGHRLNVANGAMRYRMGYKPKSRAVAGPGFLAKGVMVRGLSRTRWFRKVKRIHKPIDFKLDAARPGQIIDLPVAQAQ